MKKTKLIAMIMTGALIVPMVNLGQKTYAKEVVNHTTKTAIVNDNNTYVSVKSNAKLVDANGKEVATVTAGEMATVVKSENGKTLVRLQKTGAEGYLEDNSMIKITDGDVNKLEAMEKDGAIKNVDTLVNVRALPSMSAKVNALLTNGTGIQIVGKTGDWYKVKVGNNSGFIFGNYVAEGVKGETNKEVITPKTVAKENKAVDVVSSPNKGGNVTRPATTKSEAKQTTSTTKVESNNKTTSNTKEEAKATDNTTVVKKDEVKPSTDNKQEATDKTTVDKKDEATTSNDKKDEVKPSTGDKEEAKGDQGKQDEVKPVEPSTGDKEEVKPSEPAQKPDEGKQDEVKPVEPTTPDQGKQDEVKPVEPTKPEEKPVKPVEPTKPVKPEESHAYNVPSISPNAGDCNLDQGLTPKLNAMYGNGVYGNYDGQAIDTMGGVYTRLLSGQMSLDQAKAQLVGKYVEDGYKITDIKVINFAVPQDQWAVYMDGSDYIIAQGGMQKFSAQKQKDFYTMWNHNGQDQRYFTRVVFLMNK